MAKYTKEQVMQMVRENNVRFIRLQFTDILGSLKNVAITDKQLEKALKNDCMFDGSSIEGFVRMRNRICVCIRIWIPLSSIPGRRKNTALRD